MGQLLVRVNSPEADEALAIDVMRANLPDGTPDDQVKLWADMLVRLLGQLPTECVAPDDSPVATAAAVKAFYEQRELTLLSSIASLFKGGYGAGAKPRGMA